MKHCAYCGRQYPDDATVCAVDGQSLDVPQERKSVAGIWRGVYGYADSRKSTGKMVPFTLKLKQKWFGNFTGTVTEDAPSGIPGIGTIEGGMSWPNFEFTKQMPVGYVSTPNGGRQTVRESLIANGYECPKEPPAPPILYFGKFLDLNRVQGSWVIKPRQIPLRGGSITSRGGEGIWCAEFITSDMNANPTGGPTQPYFEKEPSPDEEESSPAEDVPENASNGFSRLGKFSVLDAEHFLKRFEEENIVFEVSRDDSPIRQMTPFTAIMGGYGGTAPMIEIFVRREDKEKATAIINEDIKI